MKMWNVLTLFIVAASFLNSGCTREGKANGAKVTITSDAIQSFASNPIPAGYKACYALNVKAPDLDGLGSTCHPKLGIFDGFYNLGQAVDGQNAMEIIVPFGEQREVELLVYLIDETSTELCPFWDPLGVNYSNVYRVASQSGLKMIDPEMEITLNLDFPGMTSDISTTDGLSADCSSTTVPGDTPPSDLNYFEEVLYGFSGQPFNAFPSYIGDGTPVFSISPASLPTGLTFDPSTGGISGTPTAVTALSSYTVTMTTEYGTTSGSLNIEIPNFFNVDILTDDSDSSPGDGFCDNGGGACSLRAAIEEIEAGGSGNYHIMVPTGSINFASAISITYSGEIHVVGQGSANTELNAQGTNRLFEQSGTLSHLYLVHLRAVNGESAGGYGGAVNVTGGDLTVRNSLFSGNNASSGGGGGAIALSSTGELTIKDSEFNGNVAGINGGAIDLGNTAAYLNVYSSHFESNSSTGGSGGAIASQALISIIEGVSFELNTATQGGAILITAGSSANHYIKNNTIYNNTAASGGTEIYSSQGASDTIYLTHNTIYGNGSQDMIFNSGSSPLELVNNIFINPGNNDCAGGGGFNSAGGNVIEDASCGVAGTNDLPGVDPLLDTLGYGFYGYSKVFPLQSTSQALNNGISGSCTPKDQTGFPRSSTCDSGAFESSF